jgi:hypothetical protein
LKWPFDAFSQDGRWVALYIERIRKNGDLFGPFVEPTLQAKKVMKPCGMRASGHKGGIFPLRGYSGNEIYSVGPEDEMPFVSIPYGEKTIEPGPVELFQTPIAGGGIDTLSDCNRLHPIRRISDKQRTWRFRGLPTTVLLNWQPTVT